MAHVARVQAVDADDLRTRASERACVRWMTVYRRKDELRTLLFGDALNKREACCGIEALGADLDACLRGVMLLLEDEVGDCDAMQQAKLEWNRVVRMEPDYAGIACKRAALLFALHREVSVRDAFVQTDRWLVRDLRDRVLPMTIPKFVAGMGQNPEALVMLVCTLCQLWPGEPMGVETHMHEAVGAADDGGDGESGGASAGGVDGAEEVLGV